MLIPTAVMNPVITELETKRRNEPSRNSPATIMTAPVRIESVTSDRIGSSRSAMSTSAMMIDIAPVACTAMKAVLVNSAPPTIPNR